MLDQFAPEVDSGVNDALQGYHARDAGSPDLITVSDNTADDERAAAHASSIGNYNGRRVTPQSAAYYRSADRNQPDVWECLAGGETRARKVE
jgi:hypothetical protein